jgi:hypothetical protein
VSDGIAGAASYLRGVTQPSGQFAYVINPDPNVPVRPGYNLLRHAGTIYALGMAQSVAPDPRTVAAMRRAAAFMRACCFSRLESSRMLAVWEPPALTSEAGPRLYKLGGAALALVALLTLEQVSGEPGELDEMRALAHFGHHLQRGNGEFYSVFRPDDGGRSMRSVSLFYPGQMALAWLMLHERHRDPEGAAAAVRALAYLSRRRAAERTAPIDHWALLATARLFAHAERLDFPRQALLGHALQICHAIVESSHGPVRLPVMEGSVLAAGRGETTSTAATLEGLLAALTFLPPEYPIVRHIEAVAHRGMAFLMRAQVRDGPYAGGMPAAITRLPDDGTAETRRFNADATVIRIDYVQHALSAMVQYHAWRTPGHPTRMK